MTEIEELVNTPTCRGFDLFNFVDANVPFNNLPPLKIRFGLVAMIPLN